MALTKAQVREILSTAGVASEKMDDAVEKIIEGHVTSITALREDIAKYKADAEKLPSVQKELDELKSGEDYKAKYDREHSDFEAYKASVQKEKSDAEKKSLYRAALKAAGVDERRFDAILKVTDLESLKMKDGKFTDEEAVKKGIADNWSDFVVKNGTKPSGKPENPPANDGDGGKPVSRAKQLAQQYSENLYGKPKA